MKYTQLSRRSASGKIDWEKQYLTFIPIDDVVFSWEERAVSGHLEYSVNGGQTWVTIANGESTPTITAGNKVMWRGDLNSDTTLSIKGGIGTFSASGNYNAYGNTMSLLFYDNYYGSQIDRDSVFAALFRGDSHIVTAPLLPSTTLRPFCYGSMFQNCTSLVVAPILRATELDTYSYNSMFEGCTSLTTAPALPATVLKNYCYSRMFLGCTSLIYAPELPATKSLKVQCYESMFKDCTSLVVAPILRAAKLNTYSYNSMFEGCTSLSYIKCLATDISASRCTLNWVLGVASTGTFVKAASMEDWTTGETGIPKGWTVIDE